MSEQQNRREKENSKSTFSVDRRKMLKQAATASSIGLLGVGGTAGTAVATHCDSPDDDNYDDEASKGTTYKGTACGELKFVTSTDVAHIETQYDGGKAWHQFYIVSEATAEWNLDNEKAYTITDNAFTIDASSVSGSLVDTCGVTTGVTPTDNSDGSVNQVFEELAGLALNYISDRISFGVTSLKTAEAISGVLNNSKNSDSIQKWEHDRVSNNDVIPAKSKIQGHFEIGVPEGSSGYVDVLAENRASSSYGQFCNDPSATNVNREKLYIWCTYDSASVYKTDAYY